MLEINNLYLSFSQNINPTLSNINLTLSRGEFCILIGSNGSGKSSLLKTITGEYQHQGIIKLDNQDISNLSLEKRAKFISIVTQDINKGCIPEMTLLENMSLSRIKTYGSKLSNYHSNIEQIVLKLKELAINLEKYLYHPLSNLSGGQRQVVATLMAFSSNAELLLLDEHTSALDLKTAKMLMEYSTKVIEEKNLTTLMITHNLDDAIRYGNRLIMLHQGEIVLDLKKEEKSNLKTKDLLELFHKYEDMNLIHGA